MNSELLAKLKTDPTKVEDIYELSPVQEGILLHVLREPGARLFYQQMVLPMRYLDVDAFIRAWDRVIARHSILRTSFHWLNLDRPMQVVHSGVNMPVAELDWRELSASEQAREFKVFMHADRQRGFSLDQAPLMRLTLIRRNATDYTMIKSHHHLILDGWSGPLVFGEVQQIYKSLRERRSVTLPETKPFRDYIDYLQKRDLTQAEAFWRDRLADFAVPTPLPAALPLSHPVPRKHFCRHRMLLPADLAIAIKAQAQHLRITVNTIMQSAWGLLLSLWSSEKDVVFGVTFSGRSMPIEGIERMVGLFINALPIRVIVKPELTIGDWLVEQQSVLSSIQMYEHTPPAQVHACSKIPHGVPLFETLVTYISQSLGWRDARADNSFEVADRHDDRHDAIDPTNYPLSLLILQTDQGVTLDITAETRYYNEGILLRLMDQMTRLLRIFVSKPDAALEDVSLTTPAEYELVVHTWNQTQVDYPRDRCLHHLFEETTNTSPTAPALLLDGYAVVDFDTLNRRANRLAHALMDRGVGTGMAVGLSVERSVEMVVGLLAILKAGGAYVPLDPAYPADRLAFMLEDSEIGILLTQTHLAHLWSGRVGTLITLDGTSQDWNNAPDINPKQDISTENLALIIYTSGSTGMPKGVAIPHRVCVNRIFTEPEPLDQGEVLCAKTSLSFIDSIWEFFLAWTWRCPTRLINREVQQNPALLVQALSESGITRLVLVPSLLRALLEVDENLAKRLPKLKHWISSGEPLPADLSRLFFELMPGRVLTNLYGTSETWDATRCDSRQLRAADGLPIGQPMGNCRVYVLDAKLHPLPVGMPGELYVGGAGLACGYQGRPELTAERFLPDPFSNETNSRIYRTGDQVCWRPDGMLEFIGRFDNQFKIRGYRVEPGEIESVLRRHPAVEASAVTVNDRQQLIAYVVAPAWSTSVADELRTLALKTLPPHMVPALVLPIDRIPLTPSGKLNRRALPKTNPLSGQRHELHHPPETDLEKTICQVWCAVLGLDAIDTTDSFFDLGGHSLLVTRVISRLRTELKIKLPIDAFFKATTIADLANWIESHRDQLDADNEPLLEPEKNRSEDLGTRVVPQSFSQQRLWFLCQLMPGTSLYNTLCPIPLQGTLNQKALRLALIAIGQRHDALRTSFGTRDGEPVQIIAAEFEPLLTIVDIHQRSFAQRRFELQRLRRQELNRPFDLTTGPLARFTLVLMEDGHQLLLASMHHLITDDWSMRVLSRELLAAYQAIRSNNPSPLPRPSLQYADYAIWQANLLKGETLDKLIAYWKDRLADLPPLDLPTNRPRPPTPTYRSAQIGFKISAEVTKRLRRLAHAEDATLFMVLLAAFQFVLGSNAEQQDVAVGTPVANRSRAELEDLIGFFVNTLVIRTDLSGKPSFRLLLQRVRESCIGAYSHQDLPFEKLVEILCPQRDVGVQPLFQVLFVLQNAGTAAQADEGTALDTDRHTATLSDAEPAGLIYYDITLTFIENEHCLTGNLHFNTDLFDADTAKRWIGHITTLLQKISIDAEVNLSTNMLLPNEERQTLLKFGQTTGVATVGMCMHHYVEERAHAHPDQLALIYGEAEYTYWLLDQRANAIAHKLVEMGSRPETFVGLYMDHCPEAIIGLLGLMKAGAAYLPLNPSFPADRLKWLLDDAQPLVVLTLSEHKSGLPPCQAQVLCMDSDSPSVMCDAPPNVTVRPESLAYLIYTSGSTGQPKGVMVEHRNLVHTIFAQIPLFGISRSSRVLATISLSFDASLGEIFRTLAAGATLCLARREQLLPGPELINLLKTRRITVVTLVPSALSVLPAEELPELRTLTVGGEALSEELANRWRKGRHLLNGYGPTETTIGATLAWDWMPGQKPPLGRPLPGVSAYVLNDAMEFVPLGMPGELYLGGHGVARGYFKRPDLTAERFLASPFDGESGQRLYRTGDRVRWLMDGQLDFLGRIDDQVKIRGYRVEPGEVAVILLRDPRLKDAVVFAQPDLAGTQRLVAYVVPKDGQAGNLPVLLRDDLKRQLPDYLVPQAFVEVHKLPLNAHGKIDRKALPNPLAEGGGLKIQTEYVEPRTPVEQSLVEIWAEMLRIDRVGIYDNFFELGGDSILGVRLISRANELGLNLTIQDIYRRQTVAEQAAASDREAKKMSAEQGIVTGHVPMTPIHRWFFEADYPDPQHFNWAFFAPAPVDMTAEHITRAIEFLWRHHDALRLHFKRQSTGEWSEWVGNDENPIRPTLIDVTGDDPSSQIAFIEHHAAALQLNLDLEHGRLFHCAWFRIEGDRGLLFLVFHHLIIDNISQSVLMEDLTWTLRQLRQGKDLLLPPKTSPFKQWAEMLNAAACSEPILNELEYWTSTCGHPPPPLPRDFPHGENSRGSNQSINLILSKEITEALQIAARGLKSTMDEIVLAALGLSVTHWAGTDRVSINIERHGRDDLGSGLDLSRTVGWFANIAPLFLHLSTHLTLVEQLNDVRRQIGALPNRGIGYGLLKYMSNETIRNEMRELQDAEIFYCFHGEQRDIAAAGGKFGNINPGPLQGRSGIRRHLFEINAVIRAGQFRIRWNYSPQVHRLTTVERLCHLLEENLIEYSRLAVVFSK